MKKNSSFALIIIGIVVLTLFPACQETTKESTSRKMDYSVTNYSGLGWLSETELAAFVTDENGGVEGYYLQNDDHFYTLDLPPSVAELDCNGVEDINYTHPSILPDGRLGLINSCISRGDPPGKKRQYMVAYDFQTKETKLLVNEPLPNYLSNGFTWNPSVTKGLQQIYGGLDGTIYWMSPEGTAPVDFVISDGERSFSPSRDFPYFSVDNTQGIVFSPAWSPDGKTIAFFATLDAIGRSGFSRSDGEYKIFFMDPVEQKPRPVTGRIHHPSELIWSPDSNWLAFVGEYGISRTHGLWIYSISSRKVDLVAPGEFENIAWFPDGKKIAATVCELNHPNLLCNRYEVWEYDVDVTTQK
jgi:hypothetical protein